MAIHDIGVGTMALPPFNRQGELPLGIHAATFDEVIGRFGGGTRKRQLATESLQAIHALVHGTGKVARFIVFGSYVTAKRDPNDVDVVLVMTEDFELMRYEEDIRVVFDHEEAAARFGASVFWTRPSMIFRETVDEFVQGWQIKRDKSRRGIVEVVS